MKKVLTLMGALSVAGSAIAHDYLWNMSDLSGESWAEKFSYNEGKFTYFGDANSRYDDVVKGVVSSVAGSATNNSFKFNVEAGDIITVHAYNLNSEAAKVYFKATDEESQESPDIAREGVLTVTANADGEVYVYADADVAITKITVVSAKYREVVDKLDVVRTAINEAKMGIADYVSLYPNFYSAVTRQISLKVSDKILRIEEELAEDAAVDGVSGGDGSGVRLSGELENLETNVLPGIITAANAAVAAYNIDFLGSDEYKAADAALAKAYDKLGADEYCMYDEGELKAEGLEGYMDSKVKAVFEEAKAGAKAELDNFPWEDNGGTYPAATHKAKVAGLEQLVKNIIDRYVYEKDNATKFASLKTLVASVANDITSTGLEAPATFEGLKTNIEDLCEELNKADNKETYTKAEIEDEDDGFEHLYSQYSIELGTVTDVASGASVMSQLTKTAYKSLDNNVKDVQKNLTEYSAKITEQYTGQEDVQAEYEQKFAELQVRLNNVLEDKTSYKDLVSGYNSLVDALNSINKDISDTWTASQNAKTAELVKQNEAAWNELQREITEALENYAKAVKSINGYQAIPGDEEVKEAIETALVKVFEYANEIETIKANAKAEYENVKDGSDSFKYQTYNDALKKASDNILNETQSARGLANKFAYSYLMTDNTNEGTLAYAKSQLDNYTSNTPYFDQNIQDLATEQYRKLKENYIDKAQAIIDEHWTNVVNPQDRDIADFVDVIEKLLKPLYTGDGENPSELDKVSNKVNAYNGLAVQIPGLKSEWSVAKANVDSDYADKIEALLSTISVSITTLEKAIQDWGLGAQDHVDDVNAEIAKIKEQLWTAINYKKSMANDNALKAINEAIDAVKEELTAAKAEVAELVSPEVVAEFTGKLDAVSFDDVENSRDALYASHDLDDETVKSKIIDVDLKAISAAIAQIVEDAKAADKAAQEVPGDVNGDKALDALDFEIIEEFVVNGASEDEAEDIKAMREQSDLNNDGKVDTRDLNEFLKLYRNK